MIKVVIPCRCDCYSQPNRVVSVPSNGVLKPRVPTTHLKTKQQQRGGIGNNECDMNSLQIIYKIIIVLICHSFYFNR